MEAKNKRITKIFSTLLVFALLVCTLLSFVSCKKPLELKINSILKLPVPYYFRTEDENPDKSVFVKNKIDWANNKNLKDIVLKAYKNLETVEYLRINQYGTVSTVTAGSTVEQGISTTRLCLKDIDRELGECEKITRSCFSNYSITTKGIAGVDIRLMSETIYSDKTDLVINRETPNAKEVKYHPKEGLFFNTKGNWTYDEKSRDDYLADPIADSLDAIFSYDIKDISYIKKAKNLIKNEDEAGNVYYSIDVQFAPKTWERYIKVMDKMLTLSGTPGKIDYQKLNIVFNIWECGLIRSLEIIESYNLEIAGGLITSKATMDTTIELNYAREERKKVLKMYTKNKCKKFSNLRKVPASISESELL